MKILIIDDQFGLSRKLSARLKYFGHSVKGISSPTSALEMIHNYDVLIANYRLPEMTGLDLAKAAHANGWRGRLLLTASSSRMLQGEIKQLLFRLLITPSPLSPRLLALG